MTDNISIVDPVQVTIALPFGYILLLVGIALIIANFFLKSPLIYLALVAVWFGVFFSGDFVNTWIQWVALPVVFWAGIGFYIRLRRGSAERGY